MTVIVSPPHLTSQARRDWDTLQETTGRAPRFDPGQADHLPEAARRWVLRAIAPGTPLRRSVVLRSRGEIKLGTWRRFHATQALEPMEGFVWAATAWVGLLPVHGFDRYHDGVGEMRWRVLDALPVMSGSGPDITRSAAGRLAGEFVLAPAAALDPRVRWKHVDADEAVASLPVGDEDVDVRLTVAGDGRLAAVTVCRWGDPDGAGYRHLPFGVLCGREGVFDGFTVPVALRGGWWPGTQRWAEGEFIRFTIEDAVYR
ncbi:hypothetical protein OUY22_12320 [Nonomuraea sp. MCN248]|uniref:DUF4166 domain-containing protein n=1 Tax=Nonomuraea corallina TaxID=2989783 RepID=A0ABT4SAW5_9ACTN|nr:DUF6544 family protein [Nonomuraea corallina]MDA0634203.1 hypothetical protein [Nonomuraea corallina]